MTPSKSPGAATTLTRIIELAMTLGYDDAPFEQECEVDGEARGETDDAQSS